MYCMIWSLTYYLHTLTALPFYNQCMTLVPRTDVSPQKRLLLVITFGLLLTIFIYIIKTSVLPCV